MRRPAFWIVLALLSARRRCHRRPLLPPGLLDRRARHHDGPRARARRGARDRGARRPRPAGYRQAASFCGDEEAQTFVELEGGGKAAFTRHAARAPLRGVHLARAALQGRRDQRDDDPLHAGRAAVRVHREAEGGRARRRARRRGGARGSPRTARRRGGAWTSRSSRWSSRARSGGRRAASITPSPTSAPTTTLNEGRYRLRLVVVRRSPDRSHALHQDPRGVHPPLREHALGQRDHRHRLDGRARAALRRSAASASACSS